MIQNIVTDKLCTQCGTCAGVCPNNNIKIRRDDYEPWPEVWANCVYCGLCLRSCPGEGVDFKRLKKEIFSKTKNNPLIGNYKSCYLGYSKDRNIRLKSSSGGIATSIAIYLLKNRLVDGIISVKDSRNPFEPEAYIARTKKDLIKAMQSKYLPVPINILLKQIINSKEKFAIVGLPCQIQGIRKAEQEIPKLKENIPFKIGMFCSFMAEIKGIEYLTKKAGAKYGALKTLRFREGKWPGNLIADGKELPFKKNYYYPLLLPFYKERCLKCIDLTNELADVSIGDAWCMGLDGSKGGYAVVIDRTKKLDLNKIIDIEKELKAEDVIRSQRTMLNFKKDSIALKKKQFKHFPNYKTNEIKTGAFIPMFRKIKLMRLFKKTGLIYLIPNFILKKYLAFAAKKVA